VAGGRLIVLRPRAVVIASDAALRRALEGVCQSAGLSVRAVERVAELERWPLGDIVVTDVEHLSPWWTRVGAAHVIAAADSAEEGMQALDGGATAWILRSCAPALMQALPLALLPP
jgi:hypothetical protein